MNIDNIEELKSNSETKNLNEIKEKLIRLCQNSRLIESNDITNAFQRHYQNIKNGIVSIDDFSFKGLFEHIETGILGEIILFFNCLIIYILEVTNTKPHKTAIDKLLVLLSNYIKLTESSFIILDILLIILSFIYISNIKNYCKQFFLLKQIFKIFEIQEQ